MKKGVYFAHAMSDYGTAWEAKALAYLAEIFPGIPILNPSDKKYDRGWKTAGMQYFDGYFLPRTKVLVFSGYPDKRIGCGVAYEMLHFTAAQSTRMDEYLPIYELLRSLDLEPSSIMETEDRFMGRYLTRAANRLYKEKGKKCR